jgi:hypothetical protein
MKEKESKCNSGPADDVSVEGEKKLDSSHQEPSYNPVVAVVEPKRSEGILGNRSYAERACRQ